MAVHEKPEEYLKRELKPHLDLAAQWQREYQQFRTRSASLQPLEKGTAWLSFIAKHRETDGDLESLVFLASRGDDIRSQITQLLQEWKLAEQEILAQYEHYGAHKNSASSITVNDIAATSRIIVPDFWSGRDEQQFTIDATILRAVEWCDIGGFDQWWKRLATETTEDVLAGALGGIPGGSWLFAMCRSDLAKSILPIALQRAFDNITIPRVQATLPWQESTPEGPRGTSIISDHIPCVSAIIFAGHQLHQDFDAMAEAIETVHRHFANGFWPTWTHEGTPSIEATAMAMHALAVARPRGWEHTMAQASAWLLNIQSKDGYWEESGAPDPVYLTVLVMDALSLAHENSGPLTFGRVPSTSAPKIQPVAMGPEVISRATPVPSESDRADSIQLAKDASVPSEPKDVSVRLETAAQRRAAVDAYIEEVFEKTGKRIRRTDIWKMAGYKDATDFQRWQRKDPRTTPKAEKAFARILSTKPHLK